MAVRTMTAGTAADPKITTTYEGCVLDVWERNGYNDSDFYAIVWDDVEGRVRQVEYATTRGWTYNNSAKVDATPDALVKAEAWLADLLERLLTAAHKTDAADPTVGSHVRSLTKRGKNVGISGWVAHREANPYRRYYRNGYQDPTSIHYQRVAVQVEGANPRMAWLDADKVEVINPAPPDPVEIRQRALTLATHRQWRAAFHPDTYR